MYARTHIRIRNLALLCIAILSLLTSCGHSWEVIIVAPDGSDFVVDGRVLDDLAEFADEEHGMPLEQILWTAGHQVIERIIVVEPEGTRHEFAWPTFAGDAWWQDDGKLTIDTEVLSVARILAEPPTLLSSVQANITDLTPTTARALGLPAPSQATGNALAVPSANHVLLLFLDGMGYVRYAEAREAGLVPNLAALGEPLAGLTVYPPSTSVATAALLTGASPGVSGVNRRGIRKTEAETIFDVADASGLQVEAIEGEALAFNLRRAEMQLSGDRDGNGSTDDNVLANTLALLEEKVPDLLFVHFHGIDDAGHSYGPGAPEEEAAIRDVDAAVGQLLAALPSGTLVIVFADHGMHEVEEEGRLGNHGNLIERDMFVPIWMVSK